MRRRSSTNSADSSGQGSANSGMFRRNSFVRRFSIGSNPTSSRHSEDALLQDVKKWDAATAGKTLAINDFDLGRTIGRGRFARVRLANLHDRQVALPLCLKILKKTDVGRLGQVDHIINEKKVLATARHNFIIQCYHTFQDDTRLYMVLELVNGGELFNVLRGEHSFKTPIARFYAAEVISALEYLHSMLIVYRDVKPENILIHKSGHIKLTDFGFAKYLDGKQTFTTCGTPSYMAPEIIRARGHGLEVDWWAIGILIYEMICGRPPFVAAEDQELFSMICRGHIQFSPVLDKQARDCVTRLLLADPGRRLGSLKEKLNGQNIRKHPFFKGIRWDDIDHGRAEPPWIPQVKDADKDTSHFDVFEESDNGDASTTASGLLSNLKFVGFGAEKKVASTQGTEQDMHAQAWRAWEMREDLRDVAMARAATLLEAAKVQQQEKKRKTAEHEKYLEELNVMEKARRDTDGRSTAGDSVCPVSNDTSLSGKGDTEQKGCCVLQ